MHYIKMRRLKRTIIRDLILYITILTSLFLFILTIYKYFSESKTLIHKSNFIDEFDAFPDCDKCPKLDKKYGNSTPNDLIITGVFGNEGKIDKFIRSLRSTGCLASLILVTNLSFPEKYRKKYLNCGAEIFQMKYDNNMSHFYPHSLRYLGYSQFFKSTNKKIDRVLHTDSYDVFFQSDPFTDKVDKNKLYFITEGIKIQNSSWNHGWLERAYNKSVSNSLGEFEVSCSGTVIGGYSQFLIYLNTLTSHPQFWANGRHSLDQAYHNYLLHTGAFTKNGIKPEFWDCNSPIITMHYCARNDYGKEIIKNDRVMSPNGKIIPSIVHQYNLYQHSSMTLKFLCSHHN